MTDGNRGGAPPRSGAGDTGPDRPRARTRTRVRAAKRDNPSSADPAASWQPQASWLADSNDVIDRPAAVGPDLVNIGFIRTALRRSRRVWAGLAVLGFLLGAALWVTRPVTPQASTRIVLNVGPDNPAGVPILNDQVLAQSRGVAQIAIHKLGLHESIDSFLASYQVAVLTDQVLRITASASSSNEAVRRSNAIASAFLTFKARQLQTQDNLYFAKLDEAVSRSEQGLKSINARITRVFDKPTSDTQRRQLNRLRAARTQAESALLALKTQVSGDKAAQQATTAAMVAQSHTLDTVVPPPPSRLKSLILFCGAGLLIGLFVGVGFVVVRTLVSDRLRRRDDVALALGAPVMLSIPAKSGTRVRPGRGGLPLAQRRDVQRVVAFLRGVLPTGSRGALAVVPVDDATVAASALVSLATSLAENGRRVVVADLCSGAPAGKLLGVKEPGVHAAQIEGRSIHVAIPEPDDIAPIGPLSPNTPSDQPAPAHEVDDVYASADVLLTLATLDPSLAGDHLRTWATDAVVVVTAGRSSWTRIHAVGELVRLAGTRLLSAVLLGADKWDESLGVTVSAVTSRDAKVVPGNGDSKATPFDETTARRSS